MVLRVLAIGLECRRPSNQRPACRTSRSSNTSGGASSTSTSSRASTAPTGPAQLPGALLEVAIRQAAATARVPYPAGAALTGTATWGREIDVQPIATDRARPEAVAAYVAKYATKSTDGLGRLDHRLSPSDLAALDLPDHLARLVTTTWALGGRPELAHLRLRDWAHTLGFRGHWLTKSRRYWTTFSVLRDARATWTSERHDPSPEASLVAAVKDWRYVGRGWANSGDAWLARTAAAELADTRRHAREARHADPHPTET